MDQLKGIKAVLEQLAAACPVDAAARDCPVLAHFAGVTVEPDKCMDSEGK